MNPQSRGRCHHLRLRGRSTFPTMLCTLVDFAYTLQLLSVASSRGLWHTVLFLPKEPIYLGTSKQYSVIKVLPYSSLTGKEKWKWTYKQRLKPKTASHAFKSVACAGLKPERSTLGMDSETAPCTSASPAPGISPECAS